MKPPISGVFPSQLSDLVGSPNSCVAKCCPNKLENCFINSIGQLTACRQPQVPLWTFVFQPKVIQ